MKRKFRILGPYTGPQRYNLGEWCPDEFGVNRWLSRGMFPDLASAKRRQNELQGN